MNNFTFDYGIVVYKHRFSINRSLDDMSTRVIKLEGDDFRKLVREEKSDIAKALGI